MRSREWLDNSSRPFQISLNAGCEAARHELFRLPQIHAYGIFEYLNINRKLLLAAGIAGTVAAIWLFWKHGRTPASSVYSGTAESKEAVQSNLHRIKTEWIRVAVGTSATTITNTNQLPTHLHRKLEQAYEFIRVANVHRFDPEIRSYKETISPPARYRERHYAQFETASHGVGLDEHGVKLLASFWDGSNPRYDENRTNRSIFYQATGPWTEDGLIRETLAILQRAGYTNILQSVESGRREVRSEPLAVQDPDGSKVRVTPFVRVMLYDRFNTNRLRVLTEHRIGPTGVLGVTEFHIH